jgi:hypothetical protein
VVGNAVIGNAAGRARRDHEWMMTAQDEMLGHAHDAVRHTVHVGPE